MGEYGSSSWDSCTFRSFATVWELWKSRAASKRGQLGFYFFLIFRSAFPVKE
jgi:hypothetical protein